MGSWSWVLHDPSIPETYTFEINPNTGGSPQGQKGLTYYQTTVTNDQVLLYEGSDQPQAVSASGTLLSQAQYQAMFYWYSKRNQFQLTDDLNRIFWVYFATFVPTRKWTAQHPWRHDWQATWYVIGKQYATGPDAPNITGITPEASGAQVTYTTPNNNGGYPLTGYLVTWIDTTTLASNSQTETLVNNGGGGTNTSIIGGLTTGHTYSVTVAGINQAGPGVPSNPSLVTPT